MFNFNELINRIQTFLSENQALESRLPQQGNFAENNSITAYGSTRTI